MLFTFPSRYWFTIGLSGVFSLAGWSPRFRTGFHVSRPTQDTANIFKPYAYGAVTLYRPTFQTVLLRFEYIRRSPTTPNMPKHFWFGLFRVRSPLLTKSLLFSFPPGTKMFQFPGLTPYRCLFFKQAGCPIRKSADQRIFAPHRSLSQLIASFFVSESQGILHTPLLTFFSYF